MVVLTTQAQLKKRLLESLGNQDPAEIGRLALDMMSNIESVYTEVGVDETSAGEDGTFTYARPDTVEVVNRADYDALKQEYMRRFSGSMGDQSDPPKQPPDDDISIEIDPVTGEEETVSLEDVIEFD